jgi:antirestriction protein ArdC
MTGTGSQDRRTQMNKPTVYEIVTERIINFIEENNSLPWTKPWATIDSPPQNYDSHTMYKGINMILPGMQDTPVPIGSLHCR